MNIVLECVGLLDDVIDPKIVLILQKGINLFVFSRDLKAHHWSDSLGHCPLIVSNLGIYRFIDSFQVINTFKYHVSCTDGKISVRINLLFYLFLRYKEILAVSGAMGCGEKALCSCPGY